MFVKFLVIHLLLRILPILIPFVVGLIQLGIEIVLSYVLKKIKVSWLNVKRLYIGVLIILGLITVVVSQAVQFYLLNGSFFWLALLSFGIYLLYFLFSYLSLLIFWKPTTFVSKIGVGFLGVWTILIFKAEPIIYLDEGGVSYREANVQLKILSVILGIGLYLCLTILQTLLIRHEVTKKSTPINPEVIVLNKMKKYILSLFRSIYSVFKKSWFSSLIVIVTALSPMLLVFIGWKLKVVLTDSLPFLFGITFIVLLLSVSNLLSIRNRWVNMIRYSLYFSIYY
ncbi:hypothetical protein [Enterococcus faecalis]|uniref:hypothetical protein n=1 Tax=Enterococcus faecalis TaxID=1351 RepID=UPI00035465DE|nr:hypothetical protein [Enterococcus faecalis]EGO5193091.1 hypothetical protein [Enterococcus faecalis]EGO8407740.1 hypothetical protein [Enterococcus faecalis]EGO8626913.1 hypothetical protein [Enterococcus faecalis]EIQ7148760.1 hypothetical protein [Enterococcus faecalis]EJR9797949.1 hypothetical protein [Enterococcus faecalis]